MGVSTPLREGSADARLEPLGSGSPGVAEVDLVVLTPPHAAAPLSGLYDSTTVVSHPRPYPEPPVRSLPVRTIQRHRRPAGAHPSMPR